MPVDPFVDGVTNLSSLHTGTFSFGGDNTEIVGRPSPPSATGDTPGRKLPPFIGVCSCSFSIIQIKNPKNYSRIILKSNPSQLAGPLATERVDTPCSCSCSIIQINNPKNYSKIIIIKNNPSQRAGPLATERVDRPCSCSCSIFQINNPKEIHIIS